MIGIRAIATGVGVAGALYLLSAACNLGSQRGELRAQEQLQRVASVLAARGDPSRDVGALRDVTFVMLGGRRVR